MDKPIVIKQDINFLDKPLWFLNLRHDGCGFVWNDLEGYEYRSGYKIPDKVDGLILLYLLYKSQQMGYQKHIELSRYEILKRCAFPINPQYCKRLEDSLKRWKNVAIEFRGTFYDGKEHISIGFGILDDYDIPKETKLVHVDFNEKWLLKIKETHFFKYINFERYKALKRSISRRLYEILCKNFKGRDEWQIHLVKLGEKLTISKREVHTREGKKEVIYASDVLVAIKPAINEINRQAEIPDLGTKLGIPPEDIFTVTYRIIGKKQERIIVFRKQPVKTGKKNIPAQLPMSIPAAVAEAEIQPQSSALQTSHPMPQEEVQTDKTRPDQKQMTANVDLSETVDEQAMIQIQAIYQDAIHWLDSIPHFHKKRKEEIASLPIDQVAARYLSIRHQYEKLAKTAKKPGPGWVYSAFKSQYIFPEDIKKAKAKEQEKERKAREVRIREIKKFIAEKGGLGMLTYHKKNILEEMPDSGLLLEGNTIAMWNDIELEGFGIKK